MRIINIGSCDFFDKWACLKSTSKSPNALYGELNLKYYASYYSNDFVDESILIEHHDIPIAGIRFTRHYFNGVNVFSCFGQPIVYVENNSSSFVNRKSAYGLIKEYLDQKLSSIGNWTWEHIDPLDNCHIKDFSRHLFAIGGNPDVITTQLIDLSNSEEEIFSRLNKSYRWGVNWGRKNLNLKLIDYKSIVHEHIEAFRELHYEAAGRETRPTNTWDCQYEMIKGQEAFICFGELDGQLVTAALFSYSAHHCFYGVSASKRNLFQNNKPLSHALIWRAIMHAKSIGCRWFEMGELRFNYQIPPPCEKELSISTFKRGFGGNTGIRLKIKVSSQFKNA